MKKLLIILAIVTIASTKSFSYTGFVETTQYGPYQMRSYYNEGDQRFVSWSLYIYGDYGTYASIVSPVYDILNSEGVYDSKDGSYVFYAPDHFHNVVLVVYKTDFWDPNHLYITRIGYASASATWH